MQEVNLWTALEEALAEDKVNLETPAEACLHLLCYMVCLSAVAATIPTGRPLSFLKEYGTLFI